MTKGLETRVKVSWYEGETQKYANKFTQIQTPPLVGEVSANFFR
jgi:hypothetical protein